MESSSPLSITSLLAAFCFLLLLLQHVLAAAARHLGSSSSCRPTTAFLPFHLPQPAPLHTPPPAPSQSHPLPQSDPFCHSRAYGHVTSGAASEAALVLPAPYKCLCKASPALLVI